MSLFLILSSSSFSFSSTFSCFLFLILPSSSFSFSSTFSCFLLCHSSFILILILIHILILSFFSFFLHPHSRSPLSSPIISVAEGPCSRSNKIREVDVPLLAALASASSKSAETVRQLAKLACPLMTRLVLHHNQIPEVRWPTKSLI